MNIKKKDGIRELFRENEFILFNTYTYERLKLKGIACEFWHQISTEYIAFPEEHISEKTAQIIRFLKDREYIEANN